MKKFALVTLMVFLTAGHVMAGNPSNFNPDETLAVGTAQISRRDLSSLRDQVAGRGMVQATATPAPDTINAGVVRVPRQDMDQIRAMVAGTYHAPAATPLLASDQMVDVGKVEIRRGELENLKRIVARHFHEGIHLTDLAL